MPAKEILTITLEAAPPVGLLEGEVVELLLVVPFFLVVVPWRMLV